VKFLFYLTFIFFLLSCSSKTNNEVKLKKRVNIVFPEFLNDNLDSIPTLSTYFKIDSLFFNDSTRLSKRKQIDLVDAELLFKIFENDELTSTNQYYFNDLVKIQKAKLKGTYEDFVKKLDIGMTLNAEAHYVGKILFPDSIALVLWELTYSSYEACPFYFGSHVLASMVMEGKVIETLQVAGHEVNADPPVDFESYYLCKFDRKGTIVRKNTFNVNEDEISIEKGYKKEIFNVSKSGYKKFKAPLKK
jgi:hypothetical protein